jgi:iron complex transport system substrate-binding protein
MRIVSLLASATEIIAALGLEERLVGRSHECDYPESVKRLPVCTSPKFAVTGSSADIDRRVKETLKSDTSVYAVDARLLDELRPDVIVTQAQCEVCAVSLRDVESAVARMTTRPKVVSLNPNSLAGTCGRICGPWPPPAASPIAASG